MHRTNNSWGETEYSKRTIKTKLTLAEAQAHCRDPETSSHTCTKDRYKGAYKSWFDGYEET